MQGLAGYIVRRLLLLPIILLAVSVVVFTLGRLAPADYVEIQAGTRASPETKERIREARGLNDPIYEQYFRYIGNVAQGDLGDSVRYRGAEVEDVIFPRLWVTLQYNAIVLFLTFAIAIPAGTWAALKRGTWLDPFTIGVLLFFAAVPVLVWIPILQWLLSVKLGILPCCGWSVNHQIDDVSGIEVGVLSDHIILPVLILTLPSFAGVARYMRAQVLEVLDQDYVRTARAKGLEEIAVVNRHIVRNALLPIVTILSFDLAALMVGSIFVETLIGIPGIGQYTFESIGTRDYDSIMAIVLLGSAAFMIANLLADIAYGFVDPRIRVGGEVGA
ncbi:MAG TPA: ABC transporter permease [Dehalococcoidia bacterium]|nr:ABC transporter permease [Dehalococcoidia bacterium]